MTYTEALALAIKAARRAGALLRAELHRPLGPRGSGAHAEIDSEAEQVIRETLLHESSYAFRGEETGAVPGADPSHCWLVDPNDGTASFLRGYRGAAVSIGLVRGSQPVLGVVFAYAYPDDDGDLITWAEGAGPIHRNGAPIEASLAGGVLDRDAVVVLSQAADYLAAHHVRCVAPARFLALPSIAYRLAIVAAGDGVGAVSVSRPYGWDYAAGDALLRAAGGALADEDGRGISYGALGDSTANGCFGGAPGAVQELTRRPWHDMLPGRVPQRNALYGLLRPSPALLYAGAERVRRAQGCLLGQLTGDALGSLAARADPRGGAPQAPRSAERRPGGADAIGPVDPRKMSDLHDGGAWNTLAGQPTGRGELALMLARSIVRKRGYVAAAALEAYAHWYASGPFQAGDTTRVALHAASLASTGGERLALAAAAADRKSDASGSLVRAAPLGILGAGRPRDAAAWAREDSALTHPSVICVEACASFVAAIAAAVGGESATGAYEAARDEAIRGGEAAVCGAVEAARCGPAVIAAGRADAAVIALQNALHRLLHASSFEEGLAATVAAGGDAASNAAAAGALLGATHGRAAIPLRHRSLVLTCRPTREAGAARLRPPEMWPVDALLLAEALLAIGR